jgi:hypothetical protein
MDEESFYITCDLCETECEVVVREVDEVPAFCPMCAAPIEVD